MLSQKHPIQNKGKYNPFPEVDLHQGGIKRLSVKLSEPWLWERVHNLTTSPTEFPADSLSPKTSQEHFFSLLHFFGHLSTDDFVLLLKYFLSTSHLPTQTVSQRPCVLCSFNGFPNSACCGHFSRVRLCATPQTAAHQAPPSLGFSRQEHWSGLPFPSPMHESEVAQSCPTPSDPMDCSPPGSSVHGIFQARVLEWGAIAFSTTVPSRVLSF